MRHRLILVAGCTTAVAVLLWVALPGQSRPKGTAQSKGTAYGATEAPGTFHFPTSADKVRITAWLARQKTMQGSGLVRVQLHIRPGWHVNANPASLKFLIPTTLAARQDKQPVALKTKYPPGIQSNIKLGNKKIIIYNNGTIINTSLASAAAKNKKLLSIKATVQSCSDKGICLPPATLSTILLPKPPAA